VADVSTEEWLFDAAVTAGLEGGLAAAIANLTEHERERIAARALRILPMATDDPTTATFALVLDGVEIARTTVPLPPSLRSDSP
jgi:hypothetical protein